MVFLVSASRNARLPLQLRESVSQYLVTLGLAGAGGPDQHETVAHHRRFEQLDALVHESCGGFLLKTCFVCISLSRGLFSSNKFIISVLNVFISSFLTRISFILWVLKK